MVDPQMVMYEEEFNLIQVVVDRLVREANANIVFIVDKNGQLIANSGDVGTAIAMDTIGELGRYPESGPWRRSGAPGDLSGVR